MTSSDIEIIEESRAAASVMHDAVRFSDSERVRALLDSGFDTDTYVLVSVDRYPALHVASADGEVEICRLLIEAGADVNLPSANGCTAMRSACANGEVAICQMLRDAGARIDCVSEEGATLLELTVRCAAVSVVQWLLSEGANLNMPSRDGKLPLHWASSGPPAKFKREIAEMLVAAGADPSFVPKTSLSTYKTPLQHAVSVGDVEAVQFFVERFGLDAAQKTVGGISLMGLAKTKPEMASYLRSLKSGAEVAGAVGAHIVNAVGVSAPPRPSSDNSL
jgi:ankyrin repeat protein